MGKYEEVMDDYYVREENKGGVPYFFRPVCVQDGNPMYAARDTETGKLRFYARGTTKRDSLEIAVHNMELSREEIESLELTEV